MTTLRPRRYESRKRKRHVYLSDEAFAHVTTLAERGTVAPSEVIEQMIRLHMQASAIPLRIPRTTPPPAANP